MLAATKIFILYENKCVKLRDLQHKLPYSRFINIPSSIYSRILTQLSIASLEYHVLNVFQTQAELAKIIIADYLRTAA
jgi:hypothetical protein